MLFFINCKIVIVIFVLISKFVDIVVVIINVGIVFKIGLKYGIIFVILIIMLSNNGYFILIN